MNKIIGYSIVSTPFITVGSVFFIQQGIVNGLLITGVGLLVVIVVMGLIALGLKIAG